MRSKIASYNNIYNMNFRGFYFTICLFLFTECGSKLSSKCREEMPTANVSKLQQCISEYMAGYRSIFASNYRANIPRSWGLKLSLSASRMHGKMGEYTQQVPKNYGLKLQYMGAYSKTQDDQKLIASSPSKPGSAAFNTSKTKLLALDVYRESHSPQTSSGT